MELFVTFSIFILVLAAITVFGYSHYVKPTRLLDQLRNSTVAPSTVPLAEQNKTDDSWLAKLLSPVGKLLPVSPQDSNVAKRELTAAGFRSPSALNVFYGCKFTLAVVLFFLALGLKEHIDSPMMRIVSLVAGAGIGYSLPGFIVGRCIKRRREQIRRALPDVLDLLVVCSEAGCGLDQGIVNVSRELKVVHPAISEELSLVNMEIMAGNGRSEALRNFGKRTGDEEVKKLVAILIQTDRFGTSISEALRTQADFLRVRRRQEAEERAGKVGVKLVFPIFFFCLPSLLVVTAGPGMLQLLQNLGEMTSGLR